MKTDFGKRAPLHTAGTAILFLGAVLAASLFAGCVRHGRQAVQEESLQPRKGGYELKFGDDFRTGMNSVDDFGISIVIVMDTSGSMDERPSSGGEAKYVQATHALETVAEYLGNLARNQKDMRINVAVLSFSSGVREVLPLTRLDGAGIAALEAVCTPERFTPDGGTAIGLALEKGSEILAQSGTIFNSLMLVTDGENTIQPEPDRVLGAIYANRNNRSTEDLPVRTSTQLVSIIGFDIDSPKFARLHELGARLTSAGNQGELEESLRSLLEADITKLEGN